mmetsp:Transcript_20766/g.48739  ORF Transcript_20766/g.48739 Transcript_20766/m.48739 type:complete len:102 (-) Transcript_20766:63-368(-)
MIVTLDEEVRSKPSPWRAVDQSGQMITMPGLYESRCGKIVAHFVKENEDQHDFATSIPPWKISSWGTLHPPMEDNHKGEPTRPLRHRCISSWACRNCLPCV